MQRIAPSTVLLWMGFAFLGGVALSYGAPWWCSFFVIFGVLGAIVFVIPFLSRYVLVGLVMIGIALGAARVYVSFEHFTEGDIIFASMGEKYEVEGMINREAELRDKGQILTIDVSRLVLNGEVQDAHGLLRVDTPRTMRFRYGDEVTFSCQLESTQKKPGGYARYLAAQNMYVQCSAEEIKVMGRGGEVAQQVLLDMKSWALSVFDRLLPQPHAGLVAGLLVGRGAWLPSSLADEFRTIGLSHIIAVSGSNITITLVLLNTLLAPLVPRKKRFWVLVIGILLFVIITGASAATVRAGWMGLLAVLGQFLGRRNSPLQLLVGTAVVMVATNPLVLLYDVGFQLSFCAMAGILYGVPFLSSFLERMSFPDWLKEVLGQTIAAQVWTTPLIWYSFGTFSLVAIIANIFVVPAAAFLMYGGMILVLLYGISLALPFVGFLVKGWSALVWLGLEYVRRCAEIGSQIPYASVQLPALSLEIMCALYTVLVGFSLWYVQYRKDLHN